MPAFNAESWIAAAAQSILDQTLADLELIIVDDGSDDTTLDVARAVAASDQRVQVLALARDPSSQSGARASNAALPLARGDYIARMDADDLAVPTRLETQVAALCDRDLDVCGGWLERFGEDSGVVWVPESHEAIAAELVFRAAFTLPTMLARAEVLKAQRFSETAAYEEYHLQTQLIAHARLGNCQAVIHRLRCHPRQTTRVLRPAKSQSHWRSRFAYFFACFPEATLADFKAVNAIPRGHAFDDRAELERAGQWLLRLSRLPDETLRRAMARRWTTACDRFFGEGEGGDLRADLEGQILAPPA